MVGMTLPRRPPQRKPRSQQPDNALTPLFVGNVSRSGRYCDGQGLYLDVRPSGSRGRIQRLTIRGRRAVIGILAPNWHETPPTARKLRQRIRAVMEWAVAMDLRPDNPCDRIGPVPGAQGNGVRHSRALPHGEVAPAIETVRAPGARPVVRQAFELPLLRAARSGEVRGAVWTEMDRNEGVWTIPGPRTKGNREHRIPLCRRALEVLEEARALSVSSPLVFPGVGGKPIANTAMSDLLRELNVAAVPHGFRSSFRDWAAEETHHPGEVAEAALAHKVRSRIEAAYRRSDLFERRLRLNGGAAFEAHRAPSRRFLHIEASIHY